MSAVVVPKAAEAAAPINLLTRRLRRITTSGRFIPEIDGLRFVAISTVFVYHLAGYLTARAPGAYVTHAATDWVPRLIGKGNYGVQLFFVISGFILGLPFASHFLRGTTRVNLKAYFLRRLTRLEPPYIVVLLCFFFLLVKVNHLSASELFPHLIAGVFYIHNVVYRYFNTVNIVAWSLEIEVQFYILVPLLSRLFAIPGKLQRRLAISGVAGVFAAVQRAGFLKSPLDLTIFNFIQFFLMGFLLADFYIADWKQAPKKRWAWDFASLVAWPALIAAAFTTSPMLLMPPLILLAYCGAFRGSLSSRLFSNPVISTIGGMCYTIYLIHYVGISVIARHTRFLVVTEQYWINLLVQVAIAAPLMLAVSGTYFLLIEQPCMQRDWPQRLVLRIRHLLSRQSRDTENSKAVAVAASSED